MVKGKDEELPIKPEEEQPEIRRPTPDVEADFLGLLKDYGVGEKAAATITKHIADTGHARVFEDSNELLEKLAKFPRHVPPVTRKNILDHWVAQRGLTISEDYEKLAAMPAEEVAREVRRRDKKLTEGQKWFVTEDGRIRMAQSDEPAITLEEAQRAVKQIRETGEVVEPVVVFDEKLGRHMPNFKNDFARTNLSAAWATARFMDKAMAEGEEVDPLDAFVEQLARVQAMKEMAGVREAPPAERGTVGEIIDGVEKLQKMAAGERVQLPAWMSDPVEFQRTVKELTTPEGGGDSALREEVKELRRAISEMREGQREAQITALREELAAMRADLRRREAEGKATSEYDIMAKGIDTLDRRAAAFENWLKSQFKLPPPRAAEEAEMWKEGIREGAAIEAEVERLADELFFPGG